MRLALFTRVEEETTDQRLVRVHCLVQDLVKRKLSSDERAACQGAVQQLVESRDDVLQETTRWQDARWELEPFEALAQLWTEENRPQASWLVNQVDLRWHGLAEWTRAEPLMRRALAIFVSSLGVQHSNMRTVQDNYASLLQALGLSELQFRQRWNELLADGGMSPE